MIMNLPENRHFIKCFLYSRWLISLPVVIECLFCVFFYYSSLRFLSSWHFLPTYPMLDWFICHFLYCHFCSGFKYCYFRLGLSKDYAYRLAQQGVENLQVAYHTTCLSFEYDYWKCWSSRSSAQSILLVQVYFGIKFTKLKHDFLFQNSYSVHFFCSHPSSQCLSLNVVFFNLLAVRQDLCSMWQAGLVSLGVWKEYV